MPELSAVPYSVVRRVRASRPDVERLTPNCAGVKIAVLNCTRRALAEAWSSVMSTPAFSQKSDRLSLRRVACSSGIDIAWTLPDPKRRGSRLSPNAPVSKLQLLSVEAELWHNRLRSSVGRLGAVGLGNGQDLDELS